MLGIRVIAGRIFTDRSHDEVVVNDTLARLLWPDGSALGSRLGDGRRVVGIVADANLHDLGATYPTIFQPTNDWSHLLLRGDARTLDQVRATLRHLDPEATLAAHDLSGQIGRSLNDSRIGATIAGGLGMLALVLAGIGTFGVFAYVVRERTREIGIRIAIGARPAHILRVVISRTGRPLLLGLAAGAVISLGVGSLLQDFLFGLSPRDPATIVGAIAVTTAAAVIASVVPAARALRVDPAVTLRHE